MPSTAWSAANLVVLLIGRRLHQLASVAATALSVLIEIELYLQRRKDGELAGDRDWVAEAEGRGTEWIGDRVQKVGARSSSSRSAS